MKVGFRAAFTAQEAAAVEKIRLSLMIEGALIDRSVFMEDNQFVPFSLNDPDIKALETFTKIAYNITFPGSMVYNIIPFPL